MKKKTRTTKPSSKMGGTMKTTRKVSKSGANSTKERVTSGPSKGSTLKFKNGPAGSGKFKSKQVEKRNGKKIEVSKERYTSKRRVEKSKGAGVKTKTVKRINKK